MSIDPPPERPRHRFVPDPRKPGAVFLHCPPEPHKTDWRSELGMLLAIGVLLAAMGAVIGAVPGAFVALLGAGWMGLGIAVLGGAAFALALGGLALAWETLGYARLRRHLARYPADVLEQASARAFAHWLAEAPNHALEDIPYRVDMRWVMDPGGLTLASFALEEAYGGDADEWQTRLLVTKDRLPNTIAAPRWSDLGVDGVQRCLLEVHGATIANVPPAVCLTAPHNLSSAHQRLPLMGALLAQGAERPSESLSAPRS